MNLKTGKLFVIEGLDGCGKETQSKFLYEALKSKGLKVKRISFPNYDSPTASLVKMYLNGDFGANAELVNAYQASTFFAVDRLGTYLTDMKDFLLKDNGIIICDRYTTSNLLYQSSKITNSTDKKKFLDWIVDFEYQKLELPTPTKTFFLNVQYDTFEKIILQRNNNKHEGKDIHEGNPRYLRNVYDNAQGIIKRFNWMTIDCEISVGQLKSREFISKDIVSHVLETLNQ